MNVAALLGETGKSWNESRVQDLFSEEEAATILSIPLPINATSDVFWWADDARGRHTVRSCYRRLVGEENPDGWWGWTRLWRMHVPPKVKLFFWQLMMGVLPTLVNLAGRKVNVKTTCLICKDGEESADHLFLTCRGANEVCDMLGDIFHSRGFSPAGWLQIMFEQQDDNIIVKAIMAMWSI
ncbi:unnamed protein product [Cuscuta epithymum]|uniref:Reverse transcriptase zinc-binding domain-containing protein n=1 Tax=Cuscuta epithymum TaxID=186058 RepID=A0AAV0EI68_9ASTE|nr:unnamed protein product [Cuscuta epithymum]